MKKLILGIIGCLFLFAGCNQSTGDEIDIIVEEEIISEVEEVAPINADAPELFVGQTMLISPDRSGVTFTCNAESVDGTITYQWYTSSDGNEENKVAIEGATAATYTTEDFIEKEIRYYFCTVTNTIPDNGDSGVKTNSHTTAFYAAYTGLPTLYLNTGDVPISAITREEYVLGTFKLMGEGITTVEYTFEKNKEGIKGRGNSSWNMPKKGYNIKFDKKQSFFGLPESKKWCIVANYSDKTLLRNKYASILGTEIFNAEWNPIFVNVDVVFNGEYLGNYTFCEKNTIGSGRIDVQDIADVEEKLAANKANKVTDANSDGVKDLEDGGFVLEIDARHDADFWFDTTLGVPVTLKDPDEVSDDVKTRIQSVVQTAEDVLYGDKFEDSTEGWRKYIDEDSVIDLYLINEFAKNVDAPFLLSMYMIYSPFDSKIHFGPNWDFDIGFGNVNYTNDVNTTSCENPEGWYVKIAKIGTITNWISRMFEDEDFVANVKSRWNTKKSDLYTSINTGLQNLADVNATSAEYNYKKWPILGTYVWPNAAGCETRATYQSEVQYLIDWCNLRYMWLDNAINYFN
ncbi:CotH kinase family protein [Treponema bryantii]|uniref:CotH kinase family protein n=1 Tax=Treponema bryantii TaxID=163 RepID=UPI0003B37B4A|nr:CotH kinase family protein [Treponema bryantii]